MIGLRSFKKFFYSWDFEKYFIFSVCMFAAFILGIIVKGYS